MLLENLISYIPNSLPVIIVYVGAIVGIISLTYAVFVESEKKHDLLRIIGSGALYAYAYYVNNMIFMIAMAGIFVATTIELVEIYTGKHKHTKDQIREYRKAQKKSI